MPSGHGSKFAKHLRIRIVVSKPQTEAGAAVVPALACSNTPVGSRQHMQIMLSLSMSYLELNAHDINHGTTASFVLPQKLVEGAGRVCGLEYGLRAAHRIFLVSLPSLKTFAVSPRQASLTAGHTHCFADVCKPFDNTP